MVALGPPSDRDESSWYFQRYVRHLPAGGEMVLFNRSWYNRAGVETVMEFCTADEREAFMEDVPHFEQLLVRSGVTLRKFYLDIGKAEQVRRLADRAENPLKQWKSSPVDAVAVKHWTRYSKARDEMLLRSHTAFAPWVIVRADDKRLARINLIKALLSGLSYKGKHEHLLVPDPAIVFPFDVDHAPDPRLAR